MIPKHDNPNTRKELLMRHNFVPLPEQIIQVNPETIRHDVFEGYSGYLDCVLTTLTPTYTQPLILSFCSMV